MEADDVNSLFNDKHLLWWILRAVDAAEGYGATREHILSWVQHEAPEWALLALREKYEILNAHADGQA